MLTGENIVCFAKDWSEDPTSNNYVMRLLARENRVLWLNSIAARTPNLVSGEDRAKIVHKLRSFFHGPQRVEPGLSVFTPLVLPLPHSDAAAVVNERIMRATIWALRRRLGMEEFQLWTFLPTAVHYVGKLGESLVVYYVTDEWSQFTNVNGGRIAAMDEELCRRADLVFATSTTLVERKRPLNPETHLASHGVDHAHFARAFDPEVPVAPEMAALGGRPIIGFFGLVQDWIDLEMIAHLAERRPEYAIVMIGKVQVDRSRLDRYRNIHWFGRKPYESLPSYCKAWSVGIMPFVQNELTRHVNPIKLREYLSAGLPVVSSDIPEVRHYPACLVARDREEFVAQCDRAIAEDTPEKRRARSEAMLAETWEVKVALLKAHVRRVMAAKRG
jgi:glycosyltransferase involved in cell wall biosynthesis